MKVLITGASSGIGMEMARYLAKQGHELILVARNKDKLAELQEVLPTKVKIIALDLSDVQQVKELFILTKKDDIDILINNAGFGACGDFNTLPLSNDVDMINTNVVAVHILTKSFLKEMEKKNFGYILNVSSSASFMPGGPLMTTYYATKSYVTSFSLGLWYELKKRKSNVSISCLCPGPVDTNFNDVANVTFSVKQMNARDVAEYAIDSMFKKKKIIIPGFRMKFTKFIKRFLSDNFLLKITYGIQKRKLK